MTNIRFVRRKEIPEAVLGEGEIALLNPERGNYYGLSGTGLRIWRLLENPTTLAQLCGELQTEFATTPAECADDAREFVEALVSENLVEIIRE